MQIMTVPRLFERLECMMFRRRLEVDIAEARPELDTLRGAAKELRTSHRFKTVLQVSQQAFNTIMHAILTFL